MRVKICGITTLDDALAACEAGADALGFVFAPEAEKRGRFIRPEDAAHIISQLPPFVTPVGVCVNDSLGRLQSYLDIVDCVQLCGEEPADLCGQLPKGRVLKVFHAGSDFQVEAMMDYPVCASLLDAFVPGEHGGTGKTCDWATAHKAVALGRPVILAGGLTPENVAEAIRSTQPYGVDTSGGVEKSPGRKDHDRLREFISRARAALPLS